MTCLADIEGQAAAVAFLQQAVARGRVPSAYLFLGPHHVGKRSTALALAAVVNCTAPAGTPEAPDACGACGPCRRIEAGNHPDVDVVAPDGQYLRIDQVRAVAERLALIPFEARKRVVILAQAERMNLPAANALLKTLEEPPEDTVLILCAESEGALPETIVSRCVPVRFRALGEDALRSLLAAQTPLEGEALDFAVRFAQGRLRPSLAEKAHGWLQLRGELVHALEHLRGAGFPQLSERVAQWAGGEDWRFVLAWLETWFHDLALHGAGAPQETLVNADCAEALERCAALLGPEAAAACHEQVLRTRDAILHFNSNRTLALEALWLEFRRIAERRAA